VFDSFFQSLSSFEDFIPKFLLISKFFLGFLEELVKFICFHGYTQTSGPWTELYTNLRLDFAREQYFIKDKRS